ncbi:MAG: glutamyl-tRNA reductase [candidate division NC10 bacterium]|nr:glutamyl-tRNA reductase [candidate division NC10 bacterium]
MSLLVIGINHKTAPLQLRERLSFSREGCERFLEALRELPDLEEAMVLSTCNRVELYGMAHAGSESSLVRALAGFHGLEPERLQGHLYLYRGEEAVRHLFRVASSLDSMVIGEAQILGQVKAAYALARERGCTGGLLDHLLERAFKVAKRVRSETGLARLSVSISSAAVAMAEKIFGSLEGKTVLMVGAGKMSELAARHLLSCGVKKILVCNRSPERAEEMAERFGGSPLPFERIREGLEVADIALTSTGSPQPILHKKEIESVMHTRRSRPLFLIDIAVPRDIDPEANQVENVYIYDLDDLQELVRSNLREREKEVERGEAFIAREVKQFMEWWRAQEAKPTIVSLRERMEEIRRGELERALARLGDLTPEQREEVSVLTSRIVNKILHHPLLELKRPPDHQDSTAFLQLVRRLFGLEESREQEKEKGR